MVDKIAYELVAPDRLIAEGEAEMVVVPGTEGAFGAMKNHAPFLSTVKVGIIDLHNGGQITDRIFVAGGFAEVTNDRVTVLAEEAQNVAEIDRSATEQALKNAREDLEDAKDDTARAVATRQIEILEVKVAAAS